MPKMRDLEHSGASGELMARGAARSLPPHAPGARMTVVKQTPSNQQSRHLPIGVRGLNMLKNTQMRW